MHTWGHSAPGRLRSQVVWIDDPEEWHEDIFVTAVIARDPGVSTSLSSRVPLATAPALGGMSLLVMHQLTGTFAAEEMKIKFSTYARMRVLRQSGERSLRRLGATTDPLLTLQADNSRVPCNRKKTDARRLNLEMTQTDGLSDVRHFSTLVPAAS
ncbi:hypothetical protein TREES_T100020449 [Tupaia chinensis]|uniref:Uncharacterized protein n=1 Tax=Tupaia chinensis TaxID=246437 RepID=L9KW42_TUPCH|nr:hypothetical protein TREES_T100020449 [Tupaia chinensis]